MAERKTNSTFSRNEQCVINCDLTYAIDMIDGRWKLHILSKLQQGKMRFTEIRNEFSFITERMLTLQLRALEKDGLLKRIVQAEVPPKVEYELTPLAQELNDVLKELSRWGDKHRKTYNTFQSQ